MIGDEGGMDIQSPLTSCPREMSDDVSTLSMTFFGNIQCTAPYKNMEALGMVAGPWVHDVDDRERAPCV